MQSYDDFYQEYGHLLHKYACPHEFYNLLQTSFLSYLKHLDFIEVINIYNQGFKDGFEERINWNMELSEQ